MAVIDVIMVFGNLKIFMNNEELLHLLIRAANDNNEFDNRRDLEYYRLQVLNRMKKQRELLEDVVKLKDRYKLDIIYRIEQYLGENK